MFGHPGKKLLFMGSEFGQENEWRHDHSLDWHLLDHAPYRGIQNLVRDLNRLYRNIPALHELDCDGAGFEWLVMHDADRSVFAWLRKGKETHDRCLVVVNFTPEIYRDYRVRVPFAGTWREVLNTDSELYGGSNTGNGGAVRTLHEGAIAEVSLVIPPLAAIFLVPER
jgi:1,4-alpha-glucan branching enzyme